MKEIGLIIIALTCFVSMNSQNLTGTWIVADGWDANGSIFEFQDNRILVQKSGSDKIDSLTFENRNGNLYAEVSEEKRSSMGTEKEKVGYLTLVTDTILNLVIPPNFESPDTMRLELVPFPSSQISLTNKDLTDLLQDKSWIFNYNGVLMRTDFESRMVHSNYPSRKALVHRDFHPSIESESWSVFSYKGIPFVFLSQFQSTNSVLIPTSLEQGVIEGKFILDGNVYDVNVSSSEELSEEYFEDRKSTLCSKTWSLSSYDTTYASVMVLIAPKKEKLNNFLKFSNLDFGPLKYEFAMDGSMKVLVAKVAIEENSWQLSKDGKYLWIGGEKSRDCIEILKLSEEGMSIKRFQHIYTEGNREIPEYLIEQTLK